MARTFQSVRFFRVSRSSRTSRRARSARSRGGGRASARRELLERVALAALAQATRKLPYGNERRLGLVRALAARRRFLLLDEPAAGLNEAESDELVEVLAGSAASSAAGCS